MASDPAEKGKRRLLRIGKYEVHAHIATGGMGAVYKAYDTVLRREVALKVLSPQMAANPAVVERFRREARSAAKLRHENIVAIYEIDEFNGTYYLALEFVDGADLHEHVGRRGKLPPEEARAIIIQAARALHHAHQAGIVHRDIKPSNFLLTRAAPHLVKLTDLGLAREVNDDEFRVTRDGTTVGTVDYMSPEQGRDSGAADIRSDIYSLGCTFYHLLTGHAPFPDGSLTERLYKHVETPPPDVHHDNPAVPGWMKAVLERMLAKKPADRYQTPAELLQDLERGEASGLPADDSAARLSSLAELAEEAARPAAPRARSRPGSSGETKSTPSRAAAKGPAPSRQRARNQDDTAPEVAAKSKPRIKATQSQPPWLLIGGAIGVLGIVALVVVLLAVGGGSQPPPDSQPIVQVRPPPPPVKDPPKKIEEDLKKPPDKPPDKTVEVITPPRLELPPLYVAQMPALTPEQLRQKFEGPSGSFPVQAADAAVFHVSRLPPAGPGSHWYRSLAEAFAHAPAERQVIIEVHDNGPLFESAAAPLVGRNLIVRAGKGHRPLIAWELAEGAGNRFLTVEKGSLLLEDLDLVVHGDETKAGQPAAFLHVKQGDLVVRGCTFSVGGKHSQGMAMVRLEAGEGPRRCRLSHCFGRGATLIGLDLQGATPDVLLDDCLLAGGEQPLCLVAGGQGTSPTVRVIRCTLVGGQSLVRVQAAGLKWMCCDSLLARGNARGEGALLSLAEGTDTDRLGWQAVNCLYAGWKDLLGGPKTISASDLASWQKLWHYTEGDRTAAETWPLNYPTESEGTPPTAFATAGTPAHFAARTRPGPLGCDLAKLPAGRHLWPSLVYDPIELAAPPADETPPPIPFANDGLYHGERLTLKDMDLGQHLQNKLARQKPGPRVVLHLAGIEEQTTSPIRIEGADLVLYFEKPEPRQKPLFLTPNPTTAGDKEALIDVTDGKLEIIGGRILFRPGRLERVPKRMLRVRGGDLQLTRCFLQGQLGTTTETYEDLIEWAGSGKESAKETQGCVISQSVLLSGKDVLAVRGGGARLQLHQNLMLAVGEGLRLDLGKAARPNMYCELKHNTLATQRTAIEVRGGSTADAPEPIVIRAAGNLFLDPFSDDKGQACLLRCDRDLLARGELLWQGRGNGFDEKHLHSYVLAIGDTPAAPQPYAAWAQLWGALGERTPYHQLLDLKRPALKLAPPLQLSRLALPPGLRPHLAEPLPGADLVRLGIVPKK